MKLTRENIYIKLKGKSKEELSELWEFLTSNGEVVSDTKECFIETHVKYNNSFIALGSDDEWKWWGAYNKNEVTIQQLKEILQPMKNKETLEQQLEKIKAEVKRLKEAIEESNKIKIGDLVCYISIRNKKVMLFGYCEDIKDNSVYIGGLNYEYKQCKKITDKDLINKLNELIK